MNQQALRNLKLDNKTARQSYAIGLRSLRLLYRSTRALARSSRRSNWGDEAERESDVVSAQQELTNTRRAVAQWWAGVREAAQVTTPAEALQAAARRLFVKASLLESEWNETRDQLSEIHRKLQAEKSREEFALRARGIRPARAFVGRQTGCVTEGWVSRV